MCNSCNEYTQVTTRYTHTHTHTLFRTRKFPQCLRAFWAAVRSCFVFCPLIHPSPPILYTLQMLPPTDSQSRTRPTPNHHYKQPQQESDTPRRIGMRRRVEEREKRGINAILEISMHMSKGVIKKVSGGSTEWKCSCNKQHLSQVRWQSRESENKQQQAQVGGHLRKTVSWW